MKKIIIFLLFTFNTSYLFSQVKSFDFTDRIQALQNKNVIFYNTDGFQISSEKINLEFNEKNIENLFKKFNIKNSGSKQIENLLNYKNYYFDQTKIISEEFGLVQYSKDYFVEGPEKSLFFIQIGTINLKNKDLEIQIINSIIQNRIPKHCFNELKPDTINFAGRKIKLENSCYWSNINTVQCPYAGEMNWSVFEKLEQAKICLDAQEHITKSKKSGKIISEEFVPIIFEGVETEAKRITYSFGKGMGLVLGAKKLTIYYVAVNTNNKNILCVLSHWNNDRINENGLPPLLAKVMSLKK